MLRGRDGEDARVAIFRRLLGGRLRRPWGTPPGGTPRLSLTVLEVFPPAMALMGTTVDSDTGPVLPGRMHHSDRGEALG